MHAMADVRLGVNIDHIATLRQQRHTPYPDLGEAIRRVEAAGADGITMHLREDRRHIQLEDVELARQQVQGTLNLEMAVLEEMLEIAERVGPDYCCLVPERREELTTEGGLDAAAALERIRGACARLRAAGIKVSLFVEPDRAAVDAAVEAGAQIVELHTGPYANASDPDACEAELARLADAACYARERLTVNAGHGLHCGNVAPVAAIPGIRELNIGHAIVCQAVMTGLEAAVQEMRRTIAAA